MKSHIELYEDVMLNHGNEIMGVVHNINEMSKLIDNLREKNLDAEYGMQLNSVYLASLSHLNNLINNKYHEAKKKDEYAENLKKLGFGDAMIDSDMASFLGDLAGMRDDTEVDDLNSISIK